MFWKLVILAAALGAAYYRWSRRRLHRLAREIPSGMKEYPIVGHAYKFLGSSEDRINALQEYAIIANAQGGLSSGWMCHRLFICMTDPKAIEIVSRACLDKDEFTIKFIRTVLGNGTAFGPVKLWHSRRKIMAPFFSMKNINQLVPLFQQKSSIMADLIRSEVGRGDFPIWKYATKYTFDTVFENVFGREMNSQKNPDNFIIRAIDEVSHMLAARMMQPWLHPDFIYHRLSIYKLFRAHLKRCYDFVDEIIRSKTVELKAVGSEGKKDDRRINFLDEIIRISGVKLKGYSDIELREETMVLIVGGNDSTALATSYTAVLLSRHPPVQDRVYQELQEVFGDSDRQVTQEDLPKLKYLEVVIKETLRLYPPFPVIVREVHNDVVLPSGHTLVDGTSILINIWGTHRNPDYWGDDAELFRPERFLEGPLRHPAQFIPFSYSLRNCVGTNYAMFSMKTALANLLRRYRLLPPTNMAAEDLAKPLRVKFNIMMKAVDNFIVRIDESNGMKSRRNEEEERNGMKYK